MVAFDKTSRLAPALALAAMAFLPASRVEAGALVTWDLTAPPSANDAADWLLLKPNNTPAPAIDRFLGHTAIYTSGGLNLVVDAFYVTPGALADFQTAFIHRAANTGALGVCDGRVLNAGQTATICGGGDTTVIDGIGNIDILRLTLPAFASLTIVSPLLFRNTDSYRIYCSDSATIDLGDASAVVASGSGPAGAQTVPIPDGACNKTYVFVTPDDLSGQPGPDRGFRLPGVTTFNDAVPSEPPITSQALAIVEPPSASLLAAWLAAFGLLMAGSRRRARKNARTSQRGRCACFETRRCATLLSMRTSAIAAGNRTSS